MIFKLRVWLIRLLAGKDIVMMNSTFDRPVTIYHNDGQNALIAGCNFTGSGGVAAISVKPMHKFPKVVSTRRSTIADVEGLK